MKNFIFTFTSTDLQISTCLEIPLVSLIQTLQTKWIFFNGTAD